MAANKLHRERKKGGTWVEEYETGRTVETKMRLAFNLDKKRKETVEKEEEKTEEEEEDGGGEV